VITTIRSKFKQTYFVYFLVFVIALSMVSSLLIKNERGGSSSWALLVNGSEVSLHDFNQEVRKQTHYLNQIRSQYGQYADLLFQSMGMSLDPKERALDILIKEELLCQYAFSLGISLHSEYIASIVNNNNFVRQNLSHIIPAFAFDQSGMLDMNILNNFLRQQGISAKQFEKSIERALLQYQVMHGIATTNYVPLFDIKEQFIIRHLGKQFSYIAISYDQCLNEIKKNGASLDDLTAFYNAQNTQLRRYWVPEQRDVFVWKFDRKNYALNISDEDIKNYYEDNKTKDFVLEPLKVEVKKINFNDLDNTSGLSLEDIRRDLLENSSSSWASQWKTMKPFARGEHKGELDKNSFLLHHEGEISPVFETENGLTIVMLVKRIPRTYKPLISVKQDIKDILIGKSFKKRFIKDVKEVALLPDKKAIESFIANKAGKKEVINNISKGENHLAKEAFSLKEGDYGFYVENEIGVIVFLSAIKERHLPSFESIKDVVSKDYYDSKARELMEERLQEVKKMTQEMSFDKIKSLLNTTIHTINMVNPADTKQMSSLEKKGLPMRELLNLDKKGTIFTYNSDKNNYIFKLDEIENFDENRFQEMRKEVKDQLGAVRTRLLLDGFVASLHRNATIETNESILIMSEEYSE